MFYPVSLRVSGRTCLVVGGGRVALRKARDLARAGARVRSVAPGFVPGFEELGAVRRRFRPGDLRGATLVVAATDDPGVNRRVFRLCAARGIPVNVVDQPELCTFIVPAVVRRGRLTLAVSTDGKSPALAKAVRRDLEKRFPPSFRRYVEAVAKARRVLPRGLRKKIATPADVADVRAGRIDRALARLRALLGESR